MNINTYYPNKRTSVSFQAKMPVKTTIIKRKNGKDIIADEFIGYHVRRGNPMDALAELPSDIASLIEKIYKILKINHQ